MMTNNYWKKRGKKHYIGARSLGKKYRYCPECESEPRECARGTKCNKIIRGQKCNSRLIVVSENRNIKRLGDYS